MATRIIHIYTSFLVVGIVILLWSQRQVITVLVDEIGLASLAGLGTLYMLSHLCRIMRLALLTLDERDKMLPLAGAHVLTAFIGNSLPFKIGEVVRVLAFAHIYGWRRKALAIWLVERFGDIIVLTSFIMGLYIFNVQIPPAMHVIFIAFTLVSLLGLVSLFAVAKVFVYLNRHLVLTSHTKRGLLLLRASHALRLLEKEISLTIEGRLTGFILLSIFIWGIVIITLALLSSEFSSSNGLPSAQFINALLDALSNGVIADSLNTYTFLSLSLGIMTFIALAIYKTITILCKTR